MADGLTAMEELSRVHEAIRHYVDETRKSVDDLTVTAYACSSEFNAVQCKSIADRQFELRHSLQYLRDGLEDHHAKESPILAPLVGTVLAQSVDKECGQITAWFQEAEATLKGAEITQLKPAELAAIAEKAKFSVTKLAELVEKHSRNIDTILQMIKNA